MRNKNNNGRNIRCFWHWNLLQPYSIIKFIRILNWILQLLLYTLIIFVYIYNFFYCVVVVVYFRLFWSVAKYRGDYTPLKGITVRFLNISYNSTRIKLAFINYFTKPQLHIECNFRSKFNILGCGLCTLSIKTIVKKASTFNFTQTWKYLVVAQFRK